MFETINDRLGQTQFNFKTRNNFTIEFVHKQRFGPERLLVAYT